MPAPHQRDGDGDTSEQQIVITEIRLIMSRDNSRLTTEKAAYRPNHSPVRALPGLAGGQGFSQRRFCLTVRAISPEKVRRFVWSLYSSLEYPRSSREALPGSGCRPPRWRFSVRHWRDGRGGVPRRSARLWDRRRRLVLGVRPLSLSLRHGSAVRRSAELGQRWPVIVGSNRSHCRKSLRSAARLKTAYALPSGDNLRSLAKCP
jgi:hypothetical protein